MKINSIELQGFASYKDYNKIVVPGGITGLVGKIDGVDGRSNGSGKSKAVMALLFALYGIGTYDKMEEIWNDQLPANADTFVRINFNLIENNYIVERGKKSGTSYLSVIENEKRIGISIKEAQEFINNLLGMNDKMFLASSFVSQGDLDAFVKAEPKTRKQYVDSFLELSLWRDAQSSSTRRYKNDNSMLTKTKVSIETLSEELKNNTDDVNKLAQELEALPGLQKQRALLNSEIAKLQSQNSTEITVQGYREIIGRIEDDRKKISSRKELLESDLKNITNTYNRTVVDFSAYDSFNEKEHSDQIQFLNTEIKAGFVYLDSNVDSLQEVYRELADKEAELNRLKEDGRNIAAGKCDKCKQDITEEYATIVREGISNGIRVLLPVIDDLKVKKIAIEEGIAERRITVPKLEKSLSDKKGVLDAYLRLKNELSHAESKYKENQTRLVGELSDISEQLVQYQNEIDSYNNKIEEEIKKTPVGMVERLDKLTEELNRVNTGISDLDKKQGILQRLQEERDGIKNKLEKEKNILKDLEKNLYYLEVLGDAFKDIPTALLKESVVEIEQYANEIIRTVLPKFKVKIYEDESKQNRPLMVAFEVDNKTRNYKLLSGGQQSLCAIGLRIGFNKIISNKAKIPLQFLVLDEIFGSLDEVNRTEVIKALNGLTTYFPQILVITHTEEAGLFPNTINVFMDENGVSNIR